MKYKKNKKSKKSSPRVEQSRTAVSADKKDPTPPVIPENELLSHVKALSNNSHFSSAIRLTNDTFSLVLRRIGDKNVLPHVHVMLFFLTTFAASPYVSHLLFDTPWPELVAFLNALVKTGNQIQNQTQNITQTPNISTLFSSPVFPNDGERTDELPLPEDYLIRGFIWAHERFPKKWFKGEQDEEERYLELASTVKNRIERVLRLGHLLCSVSVSPFSSRAQLIVARNTTAGFHTARKPRHSRSLAIRPSLDSGHSPGSRFRLTVVVS
jgi:hypothetical protein